MDYQHYTRRRVICNSIANQYRLPYTAAMSRSVRSLGFVAALALGLSCAPSPQTAASTWRVVGDSPEALLSASVAGGYAWVVGADLGHGPAVWRHGPSGWAFLDPKTRGNLWWVQGFPDGTALLGGSNATVLRYDGGAFLRLDTRGFAGQTVYGVWGRSARDAWVVGGSAGRAGFAWRVREDTVSELSLPLDITRRRDGELPALLKVWGNGQTTWFVGDAGTLMKSEQDGPLQVVTSGTSERLFTVTGDGEEVLAVGGTGSGVILSAGPSVGPVGPPSAPLLQGVSVWRGEAVAVGFGGSVLIRREGAWAAAETPALEIESLHAVVHSANGDVLAVGGNVLSGRMDKGVLLVRSHVPWPALPARPAPAPAVPATCPPGEGNLPETATMARRWNDRALAAIRRDLPRPTVHARNLFHLSGAMYDVWAAADGTARGMVVTDKRALDAAELDLALAGASWEVLSHRYGPAVGGDVSLACFRAQALALGFDPALDPPAGSALAFGRGVGKAWIQAFSSDGANEANNYRDPAGYAGRNQPLVVDEPGADMADPAAWQPLNLSVAVAQNGLVLPAGVQAYIGSHWGQVQPFALTRSTPQAPWIDAGPAPVFDDALAAEVLTVLRRTVELDPADDSPMDAGPGAQGNNPLGSNSGTGHPLNPATNAPYAAVPMRRSDFGRVLAEYWADGPKSETPPGHWNVLLHKVRANPDFPLLMDGRALPPLAWDIQALFVLNAALHDAAIAAWDIKRRNETARPISLVRHMASRGQRSEPGAPDFHASGLPLAPGLVERITAESSADGARHEHLRHFVGELAVRGWRGEPADRKDVGGVGWIRARDWLPYQRRSFVTPAFPGFVSGHSTFSRAAAEVLTAITGSAFLPGGLGTTTVPAGGLIHEAGPSAPVTLHWATWFDAADQAGQSRIWGGIHVPSDDFAGRRVGRQAGLQALAHARSLFAGQQP